MTRLDLGLLGLACSIWTCYLTDRIYAYVEQCFDAAAIDYMIGQGFVRPSRPGKPSVLCGNDAAIRWSRYFLAWIETANEQKLLRSHFN
jgi:hypothetical protein